MEKIPVYRMTIADNDETTGVDIISLVEQPAIEVNFLKFSKDNKEGYKHKFIIQNQERQLVCGPVMIPDFPIFRLEKGQEYYVYITKEDIAKVHERFMLNQRSNNVNLNHSGLLVSGVKMIETWIADTTRGTKAPEQFSTLADGTWFATYKITDPAIWEQVKEGKFKGFSIEGFFKHELIQMKKEKSELQQLKELQTLLKDIS